MKGKLFIFCFIVIVYGCSCQNTTDAQASENIQESKKIGVFIREYKLLNCTDKDIIVESAWAENVWFNNPEFGKTEKIKEKGCHLCFKLKQTPKLTYRGNNFLDWNIRFNKNKNSLDNFNVGIINEIYVLSFNECNIPDTVELDLIKRKDTNSIITDTKVGTLIFKAVNSVKKK